MNTLRDEVWEALNNALHNGNDEVYTKDPSIIASELNGDLTTIQGDVKIIEKYVKEWQDGWNLGQ
jgi:hypothetical protein